MSTSAATDPFSTLGGGDQPTHEELLGCMAACYEWADAYDTKDWARLSRCIAPTLYVDYRSFLGEKWDALPAEAFVAMASSPSFLGNPRLKTQHFVGGASRWARIDDTHIQGLHQLRVPHQLYDAADPDKVALKGHAHSMNRHWYERVGGVWKFAGLAPDIRFHEFDFKAVFAQCRREMEMAKAAAAASGTAAGITSAEANVGATVGAAGEKDRTATSVAEVSGDGIGKTTTH